MGSFRFTRYSDTWLIFFNPVMRMIKDDHVISLWWIIIPYPCTPGSSKQTAGVSSLSYNVKIWTRSRSLHFHLKSTLTSLVGVEQIWPPIVNHGINYIRKKEFTGTSCLTATSHYLNRCWSSFMRAHGITRSQIRHVLWVLHTIHNWAYTCSKHVWRCFDLHLNRWLSNNHEAGELTRYCAHYDVIVMDCKITA